MNDQELFHRIIARHGLEFAWGTFGQQFLSDTP